MHLGQGGPDHPSGKGGGQEEAGGDEDGGADEGGEEGTVDGLSPGTWLGKERPMPWIVKENNIEYFPKHTHFVRICLKIHVIFQCIPFRNKCWKKKFKGKTVLPHFKAFGSYTG